MVSQGGPGINAPPFNVGQWDSYEDVNKVAAGVTGTAHLMAGKDGLKWSSQVAAQGWTNRWALNETVGTTAADSVGGKNGTYTGGFTLNQADFVTETGTAAVALNGSTGFINLGANGIDLTTGSWGFFCLCRPTALGAAHRGLLGGPTGSVAIDLFNDNPFVSVVGGASLQIPNFSRPASLDWNGIGISYNHLTNAFTRHVVSPTGTASDYGNWSYGGIAGWPAGQFPTAGVKSNQIGRRDTGGYFQGSIQEVLFISGVEMTEAMFMALYQDARIRSVDKGVTFQVAGDSGPTPTNTTRTPGGGATYKGFTRLTVQTPAPGKQYDVAERYRRNHPITLGTAGTEWWSAAWRWPSDSAWGTQFFSLNPQGWATHAQMSYEGITAASILLEVHPTGDNSVSGPWFAIRAQGGAVASGGAAPENITWVNPAAGTGWNTLGAFTGAPPNARNPQILGPNTFLNAGSHPFTLDVWHEFIFKIVWATSTPTGSIDIWHRVRGSGLPMINSASKVFQVSGFKNFQYLTGGGTTPTSTLMKFGLYFGRGNTPLYVYHDSIGSFTTQAEAEAQFASETVSAIQLEQRCFRGRNDDGSETGASWIAAENTNWIQVPGQNFRVRFGTQEVAAFGGATGAPQLQYNKNGAGWVNVTDISSVVRSAASPFVADSASTTKQLVSESGTFVSGGFDEANGLIFTVTLPASGHSEFEFCLQLVPPDVADNDQIQLRLTYPNDANPAFTQTPTITARTNTPPATDAYEDMILALEPNLAVYYRLDDTTSVLKDEAGSVDGAYVGGYSQGQTGIVGTTLKLAVDFNGSTGYTETPHNTALNLGNGPLTIEAWVKRDSTGTLDTICSKGSGAYCLEIGTDNKIHFGPPGGTDIFVTTATLTDTANWHLITLTYGGGSDVNLYLDGLDKAGTKNTVVLTDNTLPLRLGAR